MLHKSISRYAYDAPAICYYKATCVIAGLFLRPFFNVSETEARCEGSRSL